MLSMRRIKDNVTQVRTNEKYLSGLLEKCIFAKHEKTTKMGYTYMLNVDLDKIPCNIYRFADFIRKDGGVDEKV
jgi:hypothetical protein